MSNTEEYYLDKGDPLYEPLVTYCAGLIALITLHDSKIRAEVINLPAIKFDSTVKENVILKMELFRPWLNNLHKASNKQYLVNYTIWAAEKVLQVAWQLIEDNKFRDKSPLLEFLRHIRHGVSHGNRFHFKEYKNKKTGVISREPVRLAQWGNIQIVRALQEKKDLRVVPNFLNIGDVFLLLHDVNHYLKNR